MVDSTPAGPDFTNGVIEPPENLAFSEWVIRRNPLYLISAVAMAIGARMLLVTPGTTAGDLGNILLTLIVLQFYELAVTAILLTLHAYRRSPEDLHSLLLVGVIFWTGPLAANAELLARDHDSGIGLSIGLSWLALVEFEFVRRRFGVDFSGASHALVFGLVALIVILPNLLSPQDESGRANEIALLVGWWTFAAFAAAAPLVIRRPISRSGGSCKGDPAIGDPSRPLAPLLSRNEIVFVSILLATASAHLVAMNHAFFLHASVAYAAPAIVMSALAVLECRQFGLATLHARVLVFLVPVGGLVCACAGYDAKWVSPHLPKWASDPLPLCGLLAGLLWWSAARRGLGSLFFHAGSAAVVIFGGALSRVLLSEFYVPDPPVFPRSMTQLERQAHLALMLLAGALYFAVCALWRRSRFDGAIGISLLAAAAICAAKGRFAAEPFVVAITIFWWWFLLLQAGWTRPSTSQWTALALYGMALTSVLDFHDPSRLGSRAHAALMAVGFGALAALGGRRDCAVLSGLIVLYSLTFVVARESLRRDIPNGVLMMLAAFAVLGMATALSWFKGRLLARIGDQLRPHES